jgi:hypothetical protein
MPREDKEATAKALEYGITIFKALSVQTKNITEAMIANSAMLQALFEKFPELGEKYERYREDGAKNSPLAAKSLAICAQFDGIVEQLRKLKV